MSAQLAISVPTVAAPAHRKGQVWNPPYTPDPKVAPVPRGHQQGEAPTPGAVAKQPPAYRPTAVRLPAAGTATVALTASAGSVGPDRRVPAGGRRPVLAQVPGSPVWVGGSPDAATGGVARVSVTFPGSKSAAAAHINSGLVMAVTRADGTSGPGSVRVQLDTAALAGAYGGNYAQRLRWVQLPACALTTPERPRCQMRTPLPADGGDRSGRLAARVTLTPTVTAGSRPATRTSAAAESGAVTAAAATVVLAVDSTPAGSAGDYGATSIQPSDKWSVSGTGGFNYSYPISVPPALGGAAPTVSLGYSSASVDGLTASQNAQASWVGSGWSSSPGFIERAYQGCADAGIAGSGDRCWAWGGQEVSLNGGGASGQLVYDDASHTWHLSGDSGAKIELLAGADNGAYNGEYWVITGQDGTRSYYGAGRLPAAEGGGGVDPASNAAWTQPVYCPHSGDPCYSAGSGQNSYATNMAYRWNLDYVVDPHGNTITYSYGTETNYYARGSAHTNTAYVRSGYLRQINYGWRAADVAAQASPTPAAEVVFTVGQRCTGSATECSSFANLTSATKADWPDTPFDLLCAASGTCMVGSPSYFSTVKLTQIQTLVNRAGTYQPVDTYALTHTFPAPADSTSPSPWLSQIVHTGNTAATAVALPAVGFDGTMLANRVAGSGTWPAYNHLRISGITTETGGQILVGYANTTATVAACSQTPTAPVLPSPSNNTMLCYQQYWTPPGQTTANSDWFNKYVVTWVRAHDAVAGSPDGLTSYVYEGAPAWHRDDSPQTKNSKRSWDQFRGFAQVRTQTGVAPDPITETSTTYLRGMNGDFNAQTGGTQKSVTVSDSLGDQVVDNNLLADTALETDTYSQAGGSVQAKTVSLPWSAQTASHAETSQPGLPAETADFVATGTAKTAELLSNNSWRTTQTVSVYSPTSGLLQQTDKQGDTALVGTVNSQETCSTTSYATPPGSGPNTRMLNYPARETTVSVTTGGPVGAGACPAATADNTVSDARAFYDGNTAAAGVIGTVGNITQVSLVDDYAGSAPVFATTLHGAAFDAYGRPTSTTDTRGLTTTTAYTPATGQLPTSMAVTIPSTNWTTTTTMDQARQLPTKITDPNGNASSQSYDGLGRLTNVWLPGRASPQSANFAYAYSINGTSRPSWVQGKRLRDDGTYAFTYKIYDGQNRERQIQTVALDGSNGCVVTDTFYDSHGWVIKRTNPYYESAFPANTIYPAADVAVPGESLTTYDGRGRAVTSGFYSHAQLQWQTSTAYPGAERTDVTPAAGGTATSRFTDALGRPSALWTYTTAKPDGNAEHAQVISYGYDPSGRLATLTGPAGQVWTYQYDLAGNRIGSTDPDAGASSATFASTSSTTPAVAGDLMTSTDARGQVLSYDYDSMGRRAALYAGTNPGRTLLAQWTYDTATLGKGKLASTTSYVGGASGAAYTISIPGYTNRGAPTGTSVTIPTNGPADQARLAGTYSTTTAYKAISGLPASTTYGQDGGLPAEIVRYAYNQNGVMNVMGGAADYMTSAVADPFGHNTTVTMGDMPNQVVQTSTYDAATGRVVEQFLDKQSGASHVDDTTTLWNPAGLVTAVKDLQDGTSTDLQCYTYNQLGQLTAAWTDNAGTQSAADPSVPNIGGCTTTTPTAATLGGPAPYWQSYRYNSAGNRTSMIDHALDGNPAHDTAHDYTYTGATGQTGQPDAVQSVTNSGPYGTTTDRYTYDPAGNTTTRILGTSAQNTITYTATGQTQSVTDDLNGTTAGYVYDADGQLLIQRDTKAGAATIILYLPGEQLTLATATNTLSGLRYYPTPGGPTEIRSSTGALTYQYANPQGTGLVTIDAGSSQTQKRRHFTAYGQTRGTSPSWVDNRAFLNQPADPTTGLGLLGARNYDPATGHFLQVDPLLQTADPNQLGGYTYAGNNPVNGSDPTGTTTWCTRLDDPSGPCVGSTPSESATSSSGGGSSGGGSSGSRGSCQNDTTCSLLTKPCDLDCKLQQSALPPGITVKALHNLGYAGSPDFTYADALNWAAQSPNGFMFVCLRVFGLSQSACNQQNPYTHFTGKLTWQDAVKGVVLLAVTVGAIIAVGACIESGLVGCLTAAGEGTVSFYGAGGGVGLTAGGAELLALLRAEAEAEAGAEADESLLALAGAGRSKIWPTSGSPNFEDGSISPGEGWEWRGPGAPGTSNRGAWYNPATKETLHPDLAHGEPIGPHYDYRAPDGTFYRIYPDGRVEPK